ncbi:MAG TPA: alpha-glucuronidase family glycosyl hydrolase, partial [Puia sp.]|nr:alpha-glucuronidase family glycosyl hydrolase [Puia sp.]
MRKFALILLLLGRLSASHAEDGYRLWLRYDRIRDPQLLQDYRKAISSFQFNGPYAAQQELTLGLQGLLGTIPGEIHSESGRFSDGCLIVGTPSNSNIISKLPGHDTLSRLGEEGFTIRNITLDGKTGIIIAAYTEKGVLYGVFSFLRLLQTHRPLRALDITQIPAYHYRILDHWDNLNRFVERGYAGLSLWNWFKLPTCKDPRYTDYARADASIGINGAVLN